MASNIIVIRHELHLSDDTKSFLAHLVRPFVRGIDRLEILMATEAEALAALDAKVTDLIADVRTALAALAADRDALGADGQAALDTLNAKVEAFDAEVGDADGSDGIPPVL